MKAAISTVLIASSVLAAVLTVAGLLTSGPLMRLIRTPAEIFKDGKLYLNIYIAGFLFLFLYNTATAVFQSLGDHVAHRTVGDGGEIHDETGIVFHDAVALQAYFLETDKLP